MKDQNFIDITIQKGKEAKVRVEQEFSDMSPEQLNWKPSPTRWSIAECLEHLLISDSSYFASLEKVITGTYRMSFLERYSPLTSFWGKTLTDQLQEDVKKKMKAPKKFSPTSSDKPPDFVQDYLENLITFLDYISKCREIDIDKTIITSPSIRIITYSLRDAFRFLMQHEHRHINQAIRVKYMDAFPKE